MYRFYRFLVRGSGIECDHDAPALRVAGHDFSLLRQRALLAFHAVAVFERALAAYRARDWAAARRLFETAQVLNPGDRACDLFMARCDQFRRRPPPLDWNGVISDVPSAA